MELTHIRNAAAPQLAQLLRDDRYAFAVLGNIVRGEAGPVQKIVTDHARLILSYTCPPYPGWVWLPQDADEAELARAWTLVREELPPEAGYRVNMRPELARYILGTPEGAHLRVTMRLDAYGCEAVAPPAKAAPGDMYAVGMEELPEAVRFAMASSAETGLDPLTREACEAEQRGFIERRRLFMWRLPDGQNAAVCAVTENGGLGYIGHVYTPHAHRRQGYAANLVYHVTRAMLAQGMKPALCVVSTNTAAAACYAQLGYRVRGSFCTVGMQREA